MVLLFFDFYCNFLISENFDFNDMKFRSDCEFYDVSFLGSNFENYDINIMSFKDYIFMDIRRKRSYFGLPMFESCSFDDADLIYSNFYRGV